MVYIDANDNGVRELPGEKQDTTTALFAGLGSAAGDPTFPVAMGRTPFMDSTGTDRVEGDAQSDPLLSGGPSRDNIDGGAGNDTANGDDGKRRNHRGDPQRHAAGA